MGNKFYIKDNYCTNGVVRSRGIGCEKCGEEERDRSCDQFLRSLVIGDDWIEIGMTRCVEELE